MTFKHLITAYYKALKLRSIFPGALLTFNEAPGNIGGNLDKYAIPNGVSATNLLAGILLFFFR